MVFYCTSYNFEGQQDLNRSFLITMISIGAGIVLSCMVMCCWMVGFRHILKNIFYFFTFRWALKLIIRIRSPKIEKVAPEEVKVKVEKPKEKPKDHHDDLEKDPWRVHHHVN